MRICSLILGVKGFFVKKKKTIPKANSEIAIIMFKILSIPPQTLLYNNTSNKKCGQHANLCVEERGLVCLHVKMRPDSCIKTR